MIEVSGLSVSYGEREVLSDLSIAVERGQTLAAVGESGTGKTTLGLALMGLLGERADDVSIRGDIRVEGWDVNSLSSDELRALRWQTIAMVFQDAEDALNPVHTVFGQVKEPVVSHGETEEAAERRAREVLEQVGYPMDRLDAYPHALSLGERQRVLIAMAFVCDPEVVVLDEPTSALDVLSQREVSRLLHRLCRDRTVLVITHDLSAAAHLSDHTAVLYGGRIAEMATTDLLFGEPRHPYSRGLVRSYPDMSRAKDLQGIRGRAEFGVGGCPFHPRCTQSVGVCSRKVPPLEDVGNRRLACHRGGVIPLLEMDDVRVEYDDKTALHGAALTLMEGETLAVVGESGAGKTTLGRAVLGSAPMTGGEVRLEGQVVERRGPTFWQAVQMIFQDPREALSHRLNVLQAVREPLDVQGVGSRDERVETVRRLLDEVELPSDDGFLGRYPHHLSGGEVQRLVIARALALEPRLLIADEPTSSLDASVQAKLVKLLNDIQERRGLAMMFITHDLALARKVSDHIAVLRGGHVVENGPTDAVLSSPDHAYTRRLLQAAPRLRPQ
ncbi:MAG: ABC transporter ATP-binding protein [Planctomycetota bacterium]